MDYKDYTIEQNENYWPQFPESKFVFSSNTDCDESMGSGKSIEDCMEQIDERLDN